MVPIAFFATTSNYLYNHCPIPKPKPYGSSTTRLFAHKYTARRHPCALSCVRSSKYLPFLGCPLQAIHTAASVAFVSTARSYPSSCDAELLVTAGDRSGILPFSRWEQLRLFGSLFSCEVTYRTMPKVYVLKCEHGRYYVGYTADLEARIDEHSEGAGSEWTREHKPLEVVEEYSVHDEQAGKELEKKVTLQHMMKYGVNNVRGAGYTQTRQYLHSGLESIVNNTASALAKDIDWVREQFTRSLVLHYPNELGGGTVSGIKRERADSSGASSDSEDEEEEEESSSEESFEEEDDSSAEEFGDNDAYEL